MACVPLKAVYIARPSTSAKPETRSVRPSSVRRTWRNRARKTVTAPGLCGAPYAPNACKRREFPRFSSQLHAKGANPGLGGQCLSDRGDRHVGRVIDVCGCKAKE